MEYGGMQSARGEWRRAVWHDAAGRRHESLSVPGRRRPRMDVLDALALLALGVMLVGGAVGVLAELAR